MGRAPLLGPRPVRLVAAFALVFGCAAAFAAGQVDGFPLRIVKLGGDPGLPAVRAHLAYVERIGFNAVWVPAGEAGRWTRDDAPDGPTLSPAFLELAQGCRARGTRVFVSVNPVGESGGRFRFSDRADVARVRAFYRLLRRAAGVRDFVLSFDDQPRELEQTVDLAAYGKDAAAAHLDLARRVLRGEGRSGSVWLCAAVYSDWHLEDGDYDPYAANFLDGLGRLRKKIGIVWTGPDVFSPTINRADIDATRARLGGRRILLYDNFPVNDDPRRESLALILGALRQRGADLPATVAAYLACPMSELGASRLSLATVADYLRDPARYDPDASWKRAIQTLAGDDAETHEALSTQALEWGGWIGTRNYHHWEDSNPRAVAALIDRPALSATWGYTLRRYAGRMEALRRLPDPAFRDDLLEAMERTFAVAQAIPWVQQLRGLRATGERRPAAEALGELRKQREALRSNPNASRALDQFLEATGMLERLNGKE